MSRPPIKAFEAVKRYCEKKRTCKGCPLHIHTAYGYRHCLNLPADWKIKKVGEEK